MDMSGNRWRVPPSVLALCAIALLLLTVPPVAATLTLYSVAFTPNPPMEPNQLYDTSATIEIVPSGATTFASGHEIQLQTNLTNAHWIIQVYVNGRAAARQTATGSVAFVNGVLLSYGTDNDVSLRVDVSGMVPANAGTSVMVMQAQELNNNGSPVPGSVVTINQPTTVATTPAVSPTVSAVQTTKTTASPTKTPAFAPSPTKSPGFSFLAGIGALSAAALVAGYSLRKRHAP